MVTGANVAAARKKAGISREELARRSKLSLATIQRIENSSREVASTVKRIGLIAWMKEAGFDLSAN